MSPIRVLLADDHPVVRSGIRTLLDKAVDIEVVGEASSGTEALKMIGKSGPISPAGYGLPDLKGTEVAQRLQQQKSSVKDPRPERSRRPHLHQELLESGASGYL